MYATEADVAHWLSSIPDLKHDPLPDPGDDNQQRQRKRRKLDHRRHNKLPSPPSSELRVPAAAMFRGPSSRKRTRDHDRDDIDDALSSAQSEEAHDETTPRPKRPSQALEWVPFSAGSGNDSPSRSSSASNHSAPGFQRPKSVTSRTSSSRQLRNAEVRDTGFSVSSFLRSSYPDTLETLRCQLRDIGLGYGILPASFENKLRGVRCEIPRSAFDRDQNTGASTEALASVLPPIDWVQALQRRADACDVNREPESSWNGDVHAPILEYVFRVNRFTSNGPIDFRWSQAAQIIPPYKPREAPGKMVDFCVFYRPDDGTPEAQAIDDLCQKRPGQSINHTDLGDFCNSPIALSIETKRPGIDGDNATLQLGTWQSAQWRSLRYGHDRSSRSIEFLPSIIVQGHDWQFLASILDQNGKSLLLKGVRLGGTESELAIYSLILALQRLKRWIAEDYWPAFVSDMLNQA